MVYFPSEFPFVSTSGARTIGIKYRYGRGDKFTLETVRPGCHKLWHHGFSFQPFTWERNITAHVVHTASRTFTGIQIPTTFPHN